MPKMFAMPLGWMQIILVVLSAGFAKPVEAGAIADLEAAAKHIHANVSALRERYLKNGNFHGEHYPEERLIDGETHYQLQDYQRASIILLDVIENYPDNAAFPEALFYYADSLFLARDYYGARTEFVRFLALGDRSGVAAFRSAAIARLVEVAIHLNDFTNIEQYIDLLGQNMDARARYVKGKYLYFQGEYDRARVAFAAVSGNVELAMKAAYFVGVTYVKEDRLDEAAEAFGQATDTFKDVDSSRSNLMDLLVLAHGRVLYEKDFVENAISAYNKIDKYSPYYDVALYEAAAVHMRAGNTIGAERMLEVLTMAIPESRYIPKAKLLRGHLLLSAGRYEEAEKVFTQTVKEFSPVKKLMDKALEQSGSTGEFFDLLMARSLDSLNIQSVIPKEVVMWAGEEPEVKRAFVLTDDLGKARAYTGESERLAALIGAVINGSNPVNAIPVLRGTMRQNQQFRNQLAKLVVRLMVEAEEEYDSAKILRLKQERIRLGNKVTALPVSEKQFQARDQKARHAYDEMRRELTRNEGLIDKLLAVIVGLERYISKSDYRAAVSSQVMEGYWSQLNRYRAGVESIQERIDVLKVDIEKATYQIGIGGEQDKNDDRMVNKLFSLANQYARVIPASNRTTRRLSTAFTAVANAQRATEKLASEIEAQATRKVARLRIELRAEEVKIEQYKTQLDALHGEAKEVVNGVAKENFSGIRKRFHALLLKADVGIVDIAWMRKEEHKSRAMQLSKRRTHEIQTLERDFKEVEGFADETLPE